MGVDDFIRPAGLVLDGQHRLSGYQAVITEVAWLRSDWRGRKRLANRGRLRPG